MSVELTLGGTGHLAVTSQYLLELKSKYHISLLKLFHECNSKDLAFKSLAHCIEDEGVDCGVNVAHRMTYNLIKSYLVSVNV